MINKFLNFVDRVNRFIEEKIFLDLPKKIEMGKPKKRKSSEEILKEIHCLNKKILCRQIRMMYKSAEFMEKSLIEIKGLSKDKLDYFSVSAKISKYENARRLVNYFRTEGLNSILEIKKYDSELFSKLEYLNSKLEEVGRLEISVFSNPELAVFLSDNTRKQIEYRKILYPSD